MLKSIPLFFFLDGAMNGVAGRIFGREECKNPAILDKLRGFFLTFFDFASGNSWRGFLSQNQRFSAVGIAHKERIERICKFFSILSPWKRQTKRKDMQCIERICSE